MWRVSATFSCGIGMGLPVLTWSVGGGEGGEDSEMRGRRARRTERAAGGATLSDSAPVW